MKLTVATCLWHDPEGEHNDEYQWGWDDVYRIRDQVRDNLKGGIKFVCLTNMEMDPDAPSVDPFINFLSEECHVPGRLFDKISLFEPVTWVETDRILYLDLDTIICGDLTDIMSRPEPMVLWRNPAAWSGERRSSSRAYYNSSVMLFTPGTPFTDRVWHYFNYHKSYWDAGDVVYKGWGDQDVISAALGPDMPYFDGGDGIFRLARPGEPETGIEGELPEIARIVTFPGNEGKPWLPKVRERAPWLKRYWPMTSDAMKEEA